MKLLGWFLEGAFIGLLGFFLFILADWFLFPEKERPWR